MTITWYVQLRISLDLYSVAVPANLCHSKKADYELVVILSA